MLDNNNNRIFKSSRVNAHAHPNSYIKSILLPEEEECTPPMARGDGNLREKVNKLNKGFDFKIYLVGLDDPLGTDTEPQNFDIDRRQCISNLWNPRLAVTVVLASAPEYKACKIDAKSEAEVDKIMEEVRTSLLPPLSSWSFLTFVNAPSLCDSLLLSLVSRRRRRPLRRRAAL